MSGPQCCENPPILSSSSGVGAVVEIAGLKCYVSGPSDSKLAVLLVSDIYGYEAPNLRKLADKIAAVGFYVVIPDFFYGDPYDYEPSEKRITDWIQLHKPVLSYAANLLGSPESCQEIAFANAPALAKNLLVEKGFEDAKPLIATLRSKGISAIGAVGFCWGAKVVVQLAKSDDIQAAALLRPAMVTLDDIKEVIKPIAILGAEIDNLFPPELAKQAEEILSSKPEVHSFFKIFPGVSHGWTVRYNIEDEKAVKSAEEAHQDTLNWFTTYVM